MLSARLPAFCLDVGASLIAEAGSDDLQIVEAALSAGDVGWGVFAAHVQNPVFEKLKKLSYLS